MWALEKKTLKRHDELKNSGYTVKFIWEHDFTKMKETDEDLKIFLETFSCVPRLNPRDAFYGGRTGLCKMYHKVSGSEKIKYIDFTSLYPYVNKYSVYPIGHPEIITSDFKPLHCYFGLALCSVIPPRKLFHPVLPFRSQGKLLFALCKLCSDTRQAQPCTHTEVERTFLGTWTTVELLKAEALGYKISLHEVYHFRETSDTLFKGYIDSFLKIKQESSGYPIGCDNPGKQLNYINEYLANEGVSLDPQNIQPNPGRRTVAKLCLNSFWGKFGQNDDKLQTCFVSNTAEFNHLLTDTTIDVHDVMFPTDEIALVQYRKDSQFIPENLQTNLFIAVFTTSYARLKLYNEMEKLGEDVLYYDTDSLIYVDTGDNTVPLGNYLGEFTDELNGDSIVEYVGAGPKNYAYMTSKGEMCCKIRGFTLNHVNSQKLNFNVLKDMVLSNSDNYVNIVNPRKITRNIKKLKIENKYEEKKYCINFDKRCIIDNFKTLPYGY